MAVEKPPKERTKVVLRHIPPGFNAEDLLSILTRTLTPFPSYDFYHFAPPDRSLDPYLSCRAYFNFTHSGDVIKFKEAFNGQKFIDCNKVQMVGIVEYAPFQRIPKRNKKDTKSGTIDKDPDYLEFLEELKIEPEAPPSIETIMDEIEKRRAARAEEQSSTALLDYIKSRRANRSVSPHGRGHYRKERDRHLKSDDGNRYKSRDRNFSAEDPKDMHRKHDSGSDESKGGSKYHKDEPRSRNNVKSDRIGSSKSRAIPEKALYVPFKKKTDDKPQYIIKSAKSSRDEPSENDSSSSNCQTGPGGPNEERQSYRRDTFPKHPSDYERGEYEREYRGGGYRGGGGGYRNRGSSYRTGHWRDDRGRGRGRGSRGGSRPSRGGRN